MLPAALPVEFAVIPDHSSIVQNIGLCAYLCLRF